MLNPVDRPALKSNHSESPDLCFLQMRICSFIITTLLSPLLFTEASPAGKKVLHRTSVWDTQIERLCVRRVIDTVAKSKGIPPHRWWEALRGLSARRPQHTAKAAESEGNIYETLGSIGACRPATYVPCMQVTILVPLAPAHNICSSAKALCFPERRMPLFHIQLTSASSWLLISRTTRS